MFSSVPGDPEPFPFAAKDELQYFQISIFLLDVISIHSDQGRVGEGYGGPGGEEEGGEGSKQHFYFQSWKTLKPDWWAPSEGHVQQGGPQKQKTFQKKTGKCLAPSPLDLNTETWGLR